MTNAEFQQVISQPECYSLAKAADGTFHKLCKHTFRFMRTEDLAVAASELSSMTLVALHIRDEAEFEIAKRICV